MTQSINRRFAIMKINKIVIFLFILGFVMFCLNGDINAAGTGKGKGKLTSIEEDGSVLIDGRGYFVDSNVRVIDRKGKPSKLRSLPIPTKVIFKYEYAKKGFVIISIEEEPTEVPK